MSDGRGVLPGMHEEELEVGEVVDDEFFVAGGKEVAGFLVGAVPASERWRASNGMRRDPPGGRGRGGGRIGGRGGVRGVSQAVCDVPNFGHGELALESTSDLRGVSNRSTDSFRDKRAGRSS